MLNTINERYCKINGYEDYYITESGKVFSYRQDNRGWQGLREMSIRGINNPDKYLTICLCKNDIKKYVQIHRLVATYFCNGYFDKAVVNHKDGNKHNNHYTNLEWVTQKENVNKSYVTSGVNQVRNFYMWQLIYPNGDSIILKGSLAELEKHIKDNNLKCSSKSLRRHNQSKGFVLKKNINLIEAQTTIHKE